MSNHQFDGGTERGRSYLLFFLVFVHVLFEGQATSAQCSLRPGETGVVSRIIDGDTVMLDTGLEVRLIGALAPKRPAGVDARHPWPLAGKAERLLAALAHRKPVRLFYGGRKRDRHGRALAHVFVTAAAERLWLQGALADAGLARIYSHADNRSCLEDLLEREVLARDAGKGLWHDAEYALRKGLDVAVLYDNLNSFQIVEGRVHAIGKARGRIYLNFEANWRRDFTVSISRKALARMVRGGFNPSLLQSRQIRVRGWLERRNGPLIAVTHRGQIEVLDPR